jgi:SAM-dependent methyltransferase
LWYHPTCIWNFAKLVIISDTQIEPTKYYGSLLIDGHMKNLCFSACRNKIRFYKIDRAHDLENYQKNDLRNIVKIIYSYYRKPKSLTILDIGCSVKAANYLAQHFNRVVGININNHYLRSDSCAENVELLIMDGTQLAFVEKKFDFVYSTNLYEHVNDLSKCIDEQLRVLKDGGYCYARWGPVWSGWRGHHIHEDMIRSWEDIYKSGSTNYSNNGQWIGDWSHLLLSKDEMFNDLLPKLKNRDLVNQIVDFIYTGNDINRKFFDEIEEIVTKKNIRIVFWKNSDVDIPQHILEKLRNKYRYRNFFSSESEILFSR